MNNIDLDLKKSYVQKQKCFSLLTTDEMEKLSSLFSPQHFDAGDIIVTEGDPVDSVFLIMDGDANVTTSSIKDNQIVFTSVATLHPGDSVGLNETGFYSLSGKRTATVIALTDMEVLKLNIAEFHGFALEYSHVLEVMREQASKTQNLTSSSQLPD